MLSRRRRRWRRWRRSRARLTFLLQGINDRLHFRSVAAPTCVAARFASQELDFARSAARAATQRSAQAARNAHRPGYTFHQHPPSARGDPRTRARARATIIPPLAHLLPLSLCLSLSLSRKSSPKSLKDRKLVKKKHKEKT